MADEKDSTGLPGILPMRTGDGPMTMSTREIADLVEKRHRDVMRDTRVMFEALGNDARSFAHIYQDSQNRDQEEYLLPRDLTLTLVTGYDIRLRKRVIDRLDELEGALRDRPVLDFSDPQVLLGVVNHLQGQIAAKDTKIALQGERLTKLDRIEGAVGNLTITEAAKVLKVQPRFLTNFLFERRWIYKRPKTQHWLAYQAHMPQHMDHRDHTYQDDRGQDHFVTWAVVTPAGMVRLAAMLEEHFANDKSGEPV